jgi:hypothetical protein
LLFWRAADAKQVDVWAVGFARAGAVRTWHEPAFLSDVPFRHARVPGGRRGVSRRSLPVGSARRPTRSCRASRLSPAPFSLAPTS